MIKFENGNLNDKDIEIKSYLTYAEIQVIVNRVSQSDNWAEREQNIDLLLLHFVTNLTDEEIESYGHEELLKSGFIDYVKSQVNNFNKVHEALAYTQSFQRLIVQLSKELPKLLEQFQDNMKKVTERGDKSSKK